MLWSTTSFEVSVSLLCEPQWTEERPMVCTRGNNQHRTRKPVDLIEGPNKVFKGRSTKGPQLHIHQWRPQGRWHSMILGLCEGAIAPGCQRLPSNFSGSFAC